MIPTFKWEPANTGLNKNNSPGGKGMTDGYVGWTWGSLYFQIHHILHILRLVFDSSFIYMHMAMLVGCETSFIYEC